ncbi:MAG: hypothetical protein DRI57_09850 [Deltaproteobacteria bacterium]|nr:MAG: hypothetical protein DRI57_09850 [Deltaproteobacteria bacterium]
MSEYNAGTAYEIYKLRAVLVAPDADLFSQLEPLVGPVTAGLARNYPGLAGDMQQECYAKLWTLCQRLVSTRLDTLQTPEHLKNYVSKTIKNAALDYLRKQRPWHSHLSSLGYVHA